MCGALERRLDCDDSNLNKSIDKFIAEWMIKRQVIFGRGRSQEAYL
jgi:hypothetical protein